MVIPPTWPEGHLQHTAAVNNMGHEHSTPGAAVAHQGSGRSSGNLSKREHCRFKPVCAGCQG